MDGQLDSLTSRVCSARRRSRASAAIPYGETEQASALRALLARGTLRVGDDGELLVEEVVARVLDLAARAATAGGTDRLLLHLGPAASVVHTASPAGLHRLEGIRTPHLAATLARALELEPLPSGRGETLTVPAESFARAREGRRDRRAVGR